MRNFSSILAVILSVAISAMPFLSFAQSSDEFDFFWQTPNETNKPSQSAIEEVRSREELLDQAYQTLFQIKNPLYRIDDPICKELRTQEAEQRKKVAFDLQQKDIALENKIAQICEGPPLAQLSRIGQNYWQGAREVFVVGEFAQNTAFRLTQGWRYGFVSAETFELLNHPRFVETLERRCSAEKFWEQMGLTSAHIGSDIVPAAAGLTTSAVGSWLVLRGLNRLILHPIKKKVEERGGVCAKAMKKTKPVVVVAGTGALGASVYFAIEEQKEKHEAFVEAQKKALEASRMVLEATFPEPKVQLALYDCLSSIKTMRANPLAEMREFWLASAKNKCEFYLKKVKSALKTLNEDHFARCHPGNNGASERIQRNYGRFLVLERQALNLMLTKPKSNPVPP
jgi:hypothetical protein